MINYHTDSVKPTRGSCGRGTEGEQDCLGGKVDDFCDVAVSLNELARVQTRGD